jgi:hypothetical protein
MTLVTMQIAFLFSPISANCKIGNMVNHEIKAINPKKHVGIIQAKKFQEGEMVIGKGLWVTNGETWKRNEPDEIKKSCLPFNFSKSYNIL